MIRKAGVIAAFPAELAPMVRGWRKEKLPRGDVLWRGRMISRGNPIDCVAVAAGMGRESAERACGIAELQLPGLDLLVSVGFAGGLSRELKPGIGYPVARAIDGETGESFSAGLSLGPSLALVTVDHVVPPQEKHELAAKLNADLADMEAAHVAKYANDRRHRFCCVKAISDGLEDVIPDFARFADGDGKLHKARLGTYLMCRPRFWPSLMRLDKNSRVGAVAIAEAVQKLFHDTNE